MFNRRILVPNLCLGSQLIMLHFLSRLLFRHLNVVNDIGASHETEEIINCIYGLKKSQSNEIESDKGSIVAEKPSNVRNDTDPNELKPDIV